MHISLLVPSLVGGGLERVFLNLARGFAEAGETVDLVMLQVVGDYLDDIPAAVNVVDLKAWRTLTSLPAVMGYLRRTKPDVLFAAAEPMNIVSIIAKKLTRTPTQIVITMHHPPNVYMADSTNPRERFYPTLNRLLYPYADDIIAVSEGVRQALYTDLKLPLDRITTLYNPVITPELIERAQQPTDHPWFADEIPVVLGVGRLDSQKNFSLLVRAFALVRKQHEVRLLILGEGELRDDLEKLVAELGLQDDVLLPGFASNPFAYMSACDVFVLSSIHEGLGIALIEAMQCAPAVISTDCPSGPSEILLDGTLAPLLPMNDVEAMATAITNILEHPPNPQPLRERANDFTLAKITQSYQEHLKTLVGVSH